MFILIWVYQFLLSIALIFLGFLVVPIALLFPDDSKKEQSVLRVGDHLWWMRNLPGWAKLWDNKIDGTLGDPDFRWASRDIPFGWKNTSFLGQFWWMAVRNPANYFKRFILSCDIRKHPIEKLGGQDYVRDDLNSTGWQFLRCGKFCAFYGVWKWPKTERALVIQIGNKFDLDDNSKTYSEDQEYKYFKGFTAEINPYKSIGDE